MKRIATMALAILMVGTLLTGCGDKAKGSNSNSNGDETVYTFKMANQAPPGDPQYDSFVYLEEILEDRSGGRIDVTYYGLQQPGADRNDHERRRPVHHLPRLHLYRSGFLAEIL